ncbi:MULTISPECIES: hypothetical protein [unclassified Microcoleus]
MNNQSQPIFCIQGLLLARPVTADEYEGMIHTAIEYDREVKHCHVSLA